MRVTVCLVYLLVSLSLSVVVEAQQRYFLEQQPLTAMWSPREKANIEYVTKTSSFRDGLRDGASTSLTNYFLLYGGWTNDGSVNDV